MVILNTKYLAKKTEALNLGNDQIGISKKIHKTFAENGIDQELTPKFSKRRIIQVLSNEYREPINSTGSSDGEDGKN